MNYEVSKTCGSNPGESTSLSSPDWVPNTARKTLHCVIFGKSSVDFYKECMQSNMCECWINNGIDFMGIISYSCSNHFLFLPSSQNLDLFSETTHFSKTPHVPQTRWINTLSPRNELDWYKGASASLIGKRSSHRTQFGPMRAIAKFYRCPWGFSLYPVKNSRRCPHFLLVSCYVPCAEDDFSCLAISLGRGLVSRERQR